MVNLKIFKALLPIVIASMTLVMFSCDNDDDKDKNEIYTGEKTLLPTPDNFATDLANKRISWDKIENAENYYWFIDFANKGTVTTNYVNLSSIAEDQWTSISVQAIAPVNTKWDNSLTNSYSFIFTHKTLLDEPGNFRYSTTSPNKVTVTWDAVANANEYSVTFVKISGNTTSTETKTVTETSFTTIYSTTINYTYYIYVRAIPQTGNTTYVPSKLGGARIPIGE